MQINKGYIQPKDYLRPKPKPFYHILKPILKNDIWKLDFEECPILKEEYEKEKYKKEINIEIEKLRQKKLKELINEKILIDNNVSEEIKNLIINESI